MIRFRRSHIFDIFPCFSPVTWVFFTAFHQLHFFQRLPPIGRFPRFSAVVTPQPDACHSLHVFPRFPYRFPMLAAGYTFSRVFHQLRVHACHRLHTFPRFPAVTRVQTLAAGHLITRFPLGSMFSGYDLFLVLACLLHNNSFLLIRSL